MREDHIFDSYEAAAAFLDRREDAECIMKNRPRPGQWTVTTGARSVKDPREMTLVELFEPLGRAYDREDQRQQAQYEAEMLAMGLEQVAHQVAAERGLTDEPAQQFAMGFMGTHAAAATPRIHGLEPVFRQGRKAKEEAGMGQRSRAAAAQIRGKYSFKEWSANKLANKQHKHWIDEA